jgi:hypothetical protein
MIEKFNRLLDDEQQLVLQLAELYIHDSEKRLSIGYVQDELGVSRHQVLGAFDLLKSTITALRIENIDLEYDGKGVLSIYGLTTTSMKTILENMATRSIRLNIFINSQLGIYGTQAQFLKQFGISRATYYRNIIYIRQILSEEFFNKTHRNEESVRQTIFSVIHHFFNGIDAMPIELGEPVDTLITELSELKSMHLSYTERQRLTNFLFVQTKRIRQGNVVKKIVDKDCAKEKLDFLEPLRDLWGLEEPDLIQEAWYLNIYFMVNELAPFEIEKCGNQPPLKVIQTLVEKQLDFLHQIFEGLEVDGQLAEIRQELLETNLKVFSPFYFSETFVDPTKVPFFSETYPEIDEMVKQILAYVGEQRKLRLDKDTLTQLYYTYMLILLEHLPVQLVSSVVKITVDFSNGKVFTKYITSQLQQFAPLNIEISKRLEDDTDIFLSDQRFYDVDCEQMIWESPPLAEDWEQLGDLIVKIKQNDKKIINN